MKKLPAWIQAGCGNDEYYCEEKGATFLGDKMPETCPDLTNHSSFFAEAMKNDPTLYDKLKDRRRGCLSDLRSHDDTEWCLGFFAR